jgi:hypothetical protein
VKKALFYLREDLVFIHPEAKTSLGVWIAISPIFKLSINDKAGVGHAILSAVNSSLDNIQHPKDWKEFQKQYLNELGFKSWKAFSEKSRLVSIEFENDRLRLIPTKKETNNSYNYLPGSAMVFNEEELENMVFIEGLYQAVSRSK